MPHRRSSVGFALSPKKRVSLAEGIGDSAGSRRQSLAVGSFLADTESLLDDVPQNNDEKEKKERQLDRLQQHQQSRTFSPKQSSDRRRSLATPTSNLRGLTSQQLTEHYATCIQLSAENKISVKNAFDLHLIEYMEEMMHRKDSEMNNFQMASCTLDASTKIYAYRVDSVHTDTLKMAGGLGRTQDKAKDDQEDNDEEGSANNKKRKAKRKKAVVETNLKNISVAQLNLDYDVDPMFKKTSSQLGEGSSSCGQFLNTLHLQDNRCLLMLDGESLMHSSSSPPASPPPNTHPVTIPKPPDLGQHLICPTFNPFEFTTWKLGDDDSFLDTSRSRESDSENAPDPHRFDANAVPDHHMDFDDHDAFDGGLAEEDGGDGTVVTVGAEGCQKAPAHLLDTMQLKDHLALNPSEYSYFDARLTSAWAGPSHWRLRPKAKGDDTNKDGKKKKKEKEAVQLKYEEEDDPEVSRAFAVTRKATCLTHQTFKKWTKDKTTLPVDYHYQARSFIKLYGRPAVVVHRQKKAAAVDQSISNDDRDDQDHYSADMDDGGSGYGDQSGPGYDMTDIFSQTVMGSQPTDTNQASSNFMDQLVAAPNKVAKISIGYARTAKKMDMKRLKGCLWELLADHSCDKENQHQSGNHAEPEPATQMDPNLTINFSSLYKNLQPKLSKVSVKMAENLSVPLAFVAVLDLANQHNLKLQDHGNLMDFSISQG